MSIKNITPSPQTQKTSILRLILILHFRMKQKTET